MALVARRVIRRPHCKLIQQLGGMQRMPVAAAVLTERRSFSEYRSEDEGEESGPDIWEEDPEGEKNLDPKYVFKKDLFAKDKVRYYGWADKKLPTSEEEDLTDSGGSDSSDEEDLEDFFSTEYNRSPWKDARVPYEEWSELKSKYDALPKRNRETENWNEEKVRGNIPYEKWTELKRQFGMLPSEEKNVENLDYIDPEASRQRNRHQQNPNDDKHYKRMPKGTINEERMRLFRAEMDRCLRIINNWHYTPRFFSSDPHVERVKAKLAQIKPDPDGQYRNLMDYVSDIDVLLYAYRVVKAKKMGPGTECTSIPIDNIKMDWFYKTQKELRDGTFEFKPKKIVYVKKKTFK